MFKLSVEKSTGTDIQNNGQPSICELSSPMKSDAALDEIMELAYDNLMSLHKSTGTPSSQKITEVKEDNNGACKAESVTLIHDIVDGPTFFQINENTISLPILANTMHEAFKGLPIHGQPKSRSGCDEFLRNKIQQHVCVNRTLFDKIEDYCSLDAFRTDNQDDTNNAVEIKEETPELRYSSKLCLHLTQRSRQARKGSELLYRKGFKYRGLKIIRDFKQECGLFPGREEEIEAGKDLVYTLRLYRPFPFERRRENNNRIRRRGREAVFLREVRALGRTTLRQLVEQFECANDMATRTNVSRCLDTSERAEFHELAKHRFPSAFMFISDTFFADVGAGCKDITAPVRAWAQRRGFLFPWRTMDTTLAELRPRLGHPEVLVHQGDCEHVFTVSSVRLADAWDVGRAWPHPFLASTPQTRYCGCCAELVAHWVVDRCDRLIFNPGFFCDSCLNQYLYKDGMKLGNFRVFYYAANDPLMLDLMP